MSVYRLLSPFYQTNKTIEYKAPIIFVCASAFNSTWVLMNSATDVWPDGLGSSSGELGNNAMDHHFRVSASGKVEGFEDMYVYGRRPSGIYIPRFRNIYDDKPAHMRKRFLPAILLLLPIAVIAQSVKKMVKADVKPTIITLDSSVFKPGTFWIDPPAEITAFFDDFKSRSL